MVTSAFSPSVDPNEAERFAKLAATWGDVAGPFWPLHGLNALRMGYIADLLRERCGRAPHRSPVSRRWTWAVAAGS